MHALLSALINGTKHLLVAHCVVHGPTSGCHFSSMGTVTVQTRRLLGICLDFMAPEIQRTTRVMFMSGTAGVLCPSRHLDIPLLQPGCWDPCLPSDSLRPLLPIIACSSSPPPPLLVMITLTSDAAPHLLPSLSAFTCRPPPPPSFLTLPPFLFPSSQASAFDSPWPQTICPHAC